RRRPGAADAAPGRGRPGLAGESGPRRHRDRIAARVMGDRHHPSPITRPATIRPMRRPWATFALATVILLVGLVSLPEQLGLSRQGVAAPPLWFATLADAARPLAALV